MAAKPNLTLRIDPDLKDWAATEAERRGVSVSRLMSDALRSYREGFHATVSIGEALADRLITGGSLARVTASCNDLAEALRELSQ